MHSEEQKNDPLVFYSSNSKKRKFLQIGLFSLIIVFLVTGFTFSVLLSKRNAKETQEKSEAKENANGTKIVHFASCQELTEKIKTFKDNNDANRGTFSDSLLPNSALGNSKTTLEAQQGAQYFTNTNTQITGIDEGDIVKTNGDYLYSLNISRKKVDILKINPIETIQIVGTINLQDDIYTSVTPLEILINNDKLIIFTTSYNYTNSLQGMSIDGSQFPLKNSSTTSMLTYDVSNASKPIKLRKIDIEGDLNTTRLKDGYLYFVTNTYSKSYDDPIPLYRDNKSSNEFKKTSSCNDVNILDQNFVYPTFSTIASLNLNDLNSELKLKNYIGNTETVYMSHDNIYLVSRRVEYKESPVKQFFGDFESQYKYNTVINKFNYIKDNIEYKVSTEFEGHLLNQFSLDEFENNLRVTFTLQSNSGTNSSNFLRIYDSNLKQISEIGNLAKGEKIYSSRFYGKIAVMVTFKKIDPLFVFDLSDAKNPKLKGELKIPGYSDYLQFIDDNTVIGLGKETLDSSQDLKEQRNLDFAWFQGIKFGLFDISDMSNPKEISKLVLGDRGSESEALQNHKAFVYDKKHNSIIIPATIYKIDQDVCKKIGVNSPDAISSCYGKPVSQGAQIVKIENNQLRFKGEVSHGKISSEQTYYYSDASTVRRALVVEDSVITISEDKIKVNGIGDLKPIKELKI